MASNPITEIDNFNDRCILVLLSLKKKLSWIDRIFKWFIGYGISNPEYKRREILLDLRSKKLLDVDEESANKHFKECSVIGFIPDNVEFMYINEAGEKAIYGRIFKSENKRRFNIVWQSLVTILIAVITALITNELSKCK